MSAEQKQDWTSEPWEIEAGAPSPVFQIPGLYIINQDEAEAEKIAICLISPLASLTPRDKANAARIIACVNACTGMQDPAQEIAELRAQRDALLEMAKETRSFPEINPSNYNDDDVTSLQAWAFHIYDLATEAIARAEGKMP